MNRYAAASFVAAVVAVAAVVVSAVFAVQRTARVTIRDSAILSTDSHSIRYVDKNGGEWSLTHDCARGVWVWTQVKP